MIELIKQKEFRSADSEYHSHYQLTPWITDLFDICSNKAGFPDSSVGKESACDVGYPSSIPGSGRSPGEGIGYPLQYSWVSLMAHTVKNLPAMQKTWVRSLGWEDPPEKGKATHPTILAWRILVTKSRTQPSDFHFHFSSTPTQSQNLFTCLLVYWVTFS